MMGRFFIRHLVVVMLGITLLAPASVLASQATPEGDAANPFVDLSLPQLDITMTDTAFQGVPAELEAGRYVIAFTNATDETNEEGSAAGGAFVKLPDGMTADDFVAMVSSPPATSDAEPGSEATPAAVEGDAGIPTWFYEVAMAGGPFTFRGKTTYAVIELSAGNWIYWAESPDAPQPLVEVTVSGVLPTDLPTPVADMRVEMSEFSFSFSTSLTAGTHIIEIANVGLQPHFMLAGEAPPGTTVEDVRALLATMFGAPEDAAATPESSLAYEDIREVFNTGNQSAGVTAWYELTVESGTYVAICLVPDPESGAQHAMLGMIEVFEVS